MKNIFLSLKKLKFSNTVVFIAVLLIYTLITLIIFNHRLPHIFTQYAMPDVDTDGGLWYQWYLHYIKIHQLPYDVTNMEGYPFGYDLSSSPANNLIFTVQLFVLEKILGFSWSNLIFVTNISSILTYPLSAIGGYILCKYLTKNNLGSYFAGLVFGFSFYHVYMGRGQMSINHIELIPFYFLSLFYFLEKKTTFSIFISSLIFAFLFKSDAYYAFFSGIFSIIIILFYKNAKPIDIIKTTIRYYLFLSIITLLINFNFVLSNLFLFKKEGLIQTGRTSLPKNELTNILYYFSPIPAGLFYERLRFFGAILYSIPIFIITLGTIFFRKNRILVISLFCFLISIVISAYIPILYWVNILYFKFFSMFRGVGRIQLAGFLFLGLALGVTISELEKKYSKNKILIKYRVLVTILLTIIIVTNALNVDKTWSRNTQFSKLAALYEPIRLNKNIHTMVLYPLELNFNNNGFPPPYQLLGQIIHNKPYANGATLGSIEAAEYQQRIKKLDNYETINTLTSYNIDTIIIYNNLIKNSEQINNNLKKDSRLEYVGRFTESFDKGYISANDLSRDINVYIIKKVVAKNKTPKYLFSLSDKNAKISYKKIDANRYFLTIDNLKNSTNIVFNSPFTPKWNLIPGNFSKSNDLVFLPYFKNGINSSIVNNDHINSWKVSPSSGTHMEFTLYFQPQSMVYLGNLISNTTFILVTIFLLKKLYEKII